MFDPYWVRADPYRVKLARGGSRSVTVHVRNFLARPQPYRMAVHCPEGIAAEPAVLEGTTPAESTVRVPLGLQALRRQAGRVPRRLGHDARRQALRRVVRPGRRKSKSNAAVVNQERKNGGSPEEFVDCFDVTTCLRK